MPITFYSGLKNGYQDFSNFVKAPFTVRLNEQPAYLINNHPLKWIIIDNGSYE